jgi:hypothetical protein
VFTGVAAGETEQPVTQVKRKYKPRARKCACGCGETFTPKRRRGKYIDVVHRNRAHRRKQRRGKKIAPRQQKRDPLWCVHCNSMFWGNPDRGTVYCSARCRNLAHRAKRDSAIAALADYIGMDTEDIYEIGGMKWVTAMLAGLGLAYSPESRQWYGAVDLQTITKQKPLP